MLIAESPSFSYGEYVKYLLVLFSLDAVDLKGLPTSCKTRGAWGD
ncbi:hypothetical protein NHP20013_13820 [Helicobacter bizzozeronii]|nr:hypothetical protein NHP20013_13820 [Helicobacter bizzozeronii]